MVYIDRYIHIYKFKYVYVHIRVRQQLEYTLKSKTKKRETRLFSLGWYYQTETKGVGVGAGVPPFRPSPTRELKKDLFLGFESPTVKRLPTQNLPSPIDNTQTHQRWDRGTGHSHGPHDGGDADRRTEQANMHRASPEIQNASSVCMVCWRLRWRPKHTVNNPFLGSGSFVGVSLSLGS
jgi:hypothetical protein